MATATLTISANHSFSSGGITYIGGATNYTVLNDSNDSTSSLNSGANGYGSWPLTDTALNLGTVTSVTINLRMGEFGGKGDQVRFAGAQIFKSDGTTAITSNCTASSGLIATFNLTPASIFYTDKNSWDGAVIKLLNDVGTQGSMAYYELSVDITYSTTTLSYNITGSGGILLGGTAGIEGDFNVYPSGGISFGGTAVISTSVYEYDLLYETGILEVPTADNTGSFSDVFSDRLIGEFKSIPIIINRKVGR